MLKFLFSVVVLLAVLRVYTAVTAPPPTIRAIHLLRAETWSDGTQVRTILFPDTEATELCLQLTGPALVGHKDWVVARIRELALRDLELHLVYRRRPSEEQVAEAARKKKDRPWEIHVAEGPVDAAWSLFVTGEVQQKLTEAGLRIVNHGMSL